ncbi:hypothetical protein CAI21_12005 [Alkalilimnicola ehrlichii]|uniref:Glyoxalase-like domain-containing protein n=1 Tax=Alkalilimnicola ehrlichii TaxID=351052 RepID=A0A3E0WU83_9GAMM|nr:VOC family protein [Alkalilimnicola ehrlichii]RFA28578.1 hypothetical protein CAI21_12005 [Alkalilimnicola ehrlichii]RFA35743.1 hypothetical protein CAL65_12525 [Alkalilimnicola ehrlichii]
MLICSHVLCKVADIRTAVRDFERLGFSVAWGSAPRRAHNALLWFEEGPFIELFELPRGFRYLRRPLGWVYGRAAGSRLARWAESAEGWCDVALEPPQPAGRTGTADDPTDLSAVHAALSRTGLPLSRTARGRRTRPDGADVRYRFFAPEPAQLPFVVSPYDPPQRPPRIEHPNGARRIERVRMSVAPADRGRFEALTAGDAWLAAEPGPRTAVLEVALAGLERPLDARLTHGAAFAYGAQEQGERNHGYGRSVAAADKRDGVDAG